jgi:hypothetical protein
VTFGGREIAVSEGFVALDQGTLAASRQQKGGYCDNGDRSESLDHDAPRKTNASV